MTHQRDREEERARTNGIGAASGGDARGNVCPRALILGLLLDPDQFGVGESSGLGADEIKGERTDLLDAREGDVLCSSCQSLREEKREERREKREERREKRTNKVSTGVEFLTFCKEIIKDLSGAEDVATNLLGVDDGRVCKTCVKQQEQEDLKRKRKRKRRRTNRE